MRRSVFERDKDQRFLDKLVELRQRLVWKSMPLC